MSWLDEVPWNGEGLIAAIAQDASTQRVLTVAWMNREALDETARTKRAVYWSRSRKSLWRKGESSGHTQALRSFHIDCDGDTLLVKVDQTGPACHTGEKTCFFTKV